jgi:hypothetical protein
MAHHEFLNTPKHNALFLPRPDTMSACADCDLSVKSFSFVTFAALTHAYTQCSNGTLQSAMTLSRRDLIPFDKHNELS